jgi:curli biogenesis system outer membrane secretion channel CsgG
MKLMLGKLTPCLALLALACAEAAPYVPATATSACYKDASKRYTERTDKCRDKACVDSETESYRLEQEACP